MYNAHFIARIAPSSKSSHSLTHTHTHQHTRRWHTIGGAWTPNQQPICVTTLVRSPRAIAARTINTISTHVRACKEGAHITHGIHVHTAATRCAGTVKTAEKEWWRRNRPYNMRTWYLVESAQWSITVFRARAF